MRSWFGLTVMLWSASAAADPSFTSAPLAGALEYCVNSAVNQAKVAAIVDAKMSSKLEMFGKLEAPPPVEPEPAKVRIGDDPPANGLTANEINRVIYASAKQIRGCYQKQLAASPDLAGKVVVSFRISETGAVVAAKIASSTLKSPPVEACMLAEIKKLAFPAKAVANVTYPFIFSQGR